MKLCFWVTGTKNRKHSLLAKPQETCSQEAKTGDKIFWADILKGPYPWNDDHMFLMFLYLLSIFTITHHLLIISCGPQGIRLPPLHLPLTLHVVLRDKASPFAFLLNPKGTTHCQNLRWLVDFWSTNYNIFINLDALEEKVIQPIYGV